MTSRDKVIAKLKDQLDVLNAKLAELETRADQASGDAKAKYEKQVRHLNEMAQPARDKFAELKTAGSPAWQARLAMLLNPSSETMDSGKSTLSHRAAMGEAASGITGIRRSVFR